MNQPTLLIVLLTPWPPVYSPSLLPFLSPSLASSPPSQAPACRAPRPWSPSAERGRSPLTALQFNIIMVVHSLVSLKPELNFNKMRSDEHLPRDDL